MQYLEIICIAIWYNPALTVQWMETRQITSNFFQSLYENRSNLNRDYNKGRALYGMASLLTLAENIPPSIQPGLPSLIQWLAVITHEIIELRESDDIVDSDSEIDDDPAVVRNKIK